MICPQRPTKPEVPIVADNILLERIEYSNGMSFMLSCSGIILIGPFHIPFAPQGFQEDKKTNVRDVSMYLGVEGTQVAKDMSEYSTQK